MLLSLPRELRDQIYRELLCRPGGLCLEYHHESKHLCQSALNSENQAHPSIILACKSTYSEARPILYSSTTLVIAKAFPQSILSFLESLAPEDRYAIKSITFRDPIPLPCFVANFIWWHPLSAYLTTSLHLRTITISPPVESALFQPDTFHPAPTSYHHPQDCWWPPARQFVSLLMDPATALQELRLQYRAYRNPRTGEVASFRSKEDVDVEALFALRMLRIPRAMEEKMEEAEEIEGMQMIGSVGIRARAYNEEVLREGKSREKYRFTVTRQEGDYVGSLRSILLILRQDGGA